MSRLRVIFALLTLFVASAASVAQPAPTIVGYIAYVGNDHNVYVVDDAQQPRALTSDASDNRRYQFPTWSTDGRLAFFCCDNAFSGDFALKAFVATPDLTAAKLLYDAENEGYTYSYWSPANCADGPSCRDLAVLITQPGLPFKVELIRQNGSTTTSRTAATGAPFYISWNADGHRMMWHRNNRTISTFDAGTDADAVDLSVTTSGLQAPQWSPIDDRAAMVLLETSGSSNALVVIDGDDSSVLVQGIPAAIRGFSNVTALNWSPDGRYIAYRAINRFGASPVFVIDALSATMVASTSDVNVLAFFWSPDSSKLAYMTPGAPEGSANAALTRVSAQTGDNLFTWSVLDVESNVAKPLTAFAPTAATVYLLAYFDQFSQSHRIWSPDSRYLVYAETADGGSSSVKILDTSSDAPVPFTVAGGEIGIWSYN